MNRKEMAVGSAALGFIKKKKKTGKELETKECFS